MTSTHILVVARELAWALALPLAWTVDPAFGEPRSVLHPVSWLGSVLAPVGRVLHDATAAVALVGCASVWLANAATPVVGARAS